jgi:hypothetical protein
MKTEERRERGASVVPIDLSYGDGREEREEHQR